MERELFELAPSCPQGALSTVEEKQEKSREERKETEKVGGDGQAKTMRAGTAGAEIRSRDQNSEPQRLTGENKVRN